MTTAVFSCFYPAMPKTVAANDLDVWCSKERGRASSVARICEVTPTSVYKWRDGKALPGRNTRNTLLAMIGIDPNDWDRQPAKSKRK